jgi:hypothetical protein
MRFKLATATGVGVLARSVPESGTTLFIAQYEGEGL